ncbi:MAG: S-adenosylmethionine decarboxylase family protein [Novipirellula sp. JB048]
MQPAQPVGSEWVIDAYGCAPSRLQDLALLVAICEEVIADLGLQVIGRPQRHTFPGPGGVTAMYMLSESHLACHTYPEHRLATFNLYCCRVRPAWPWQDQLASRLGATQVAVRYLDRGSIAALRSGPRGQA